MAVFVEANYQKRIGLAAYSSHACENFRGQLREVSAIDEVM